MTTPFTSYSFAASPGFGGTALRTLTERLRDSNNIKEFGVLGNGTNEFTAIQNAIDFMYAAGGGTLFFPAGTYNLGTNRLRLSPDYGVVGQKPTPIRLIGAGRDVTVITGNFGTGAGVPMSADPNYLLVSFNASGQPLETFGTTVHTVEDLTIWNTSTVSGAGAICWQHSSPFHVQLLNCRFIGRSGIYFNNHVEGGTIRGCIAQSNDTLSGFPPADQYTPFSYPPTFSSGSLGFWFSTHDFVNNIAIGFDVGFAMVSDIGTNALGVIIGNLASRCRIGWQIASADVVFASNRADRCQVGFLVGGGGLNLCSCCITGTSGPPEPANVSNISFLGGTVTVTTSVNHNIPNGTAVQLSNDLSPWWPNSTGIVTATVGGNPEEFSYTGPNGVSPTTGTWTYPVNAGISITTLGLSNIAGSYFDVAACSFAHLDMTGFGSRSGADPHFKGLTILATKCSDMGAANGRL